MSSRIRKYDIHVSEAETIIAFDKASSIVHCAFQRGLLCLWFQLYDGEDERFISPFRAFRVFRTGHEIPGRWHHVGTAIDPEGGVFHVCEREGEDGQAE